MGPRRLGDDDTYHCGLLRALLIALSLGIVGCAAAPKPPPVEVVVPPKQVERPGKYYMDDGPPDRVPGNLLEIPHAVPRDEPFHRFANRPYTVFGRTYVPVLNKEPTVERGVASWYGRKFHGQKTASGETYDMFAMTAAHPTMPIPSYARVTNLRTGDWVVVRVNDRGPFLSQRIIDLSYAAAARIGIVASGSGMVEVERVFEAPEPGITSAQRAPPVPAVVQTPVVVAEPAGIWLQLGAFSSAEGAEIFRERLKRDLAWFSEPAVVSVRDGLHRVRLGPFVTRTEALAISDKVRQTLGFAPTLIGR